MKEGVHSRGRWLYAAAVCIVIALGLLSRSSHIGLPRFWAKYSGDALWALMVFLLVGMLFPRRPVWFVGAAAFAYSCATEFSQLIHAPWIDRIRHNTLGRLILGDTFAWADLAAYLVGVLAGMTIEQAISRGCSKSKRQGINDTQ